MCLAYLYEMSVAFLLIFIVYFYYFTSKFIIQTIGIQKNCCFLLLIALFYFMLQANSKIVLLFCLYNNLLVQFITFRV